MGRKVVLIMAVIVAAVSVMAGAAEQQRAKEILDAAGIHGGLVVHVGCSDGKLTAALRTPHAPRDEEHHAERGEYGVLIVQGLDTDVTAARQHIQSLGLYGPVSARQWDGHRLPYTDNLVNLIVADKLDGVTNEELLRVLAPRGVALIGGKKTVKPWPQDIDEWSHYYHGPDGNPVANDRVVGPPKHYQWLAGPLWMRDHDTDSSISTIVTARGRMFYIVDEAPIALAGQHSLPDKWCLAARDAFNGVLLWKVPIKDWGWRQWKQTWFTDRPGDFPLNLQKRLVAAGDRVYATLGYHAPVSELDAATGRVLRTLAGTEEAREILCGGGQLMLAMHRPGGLKVAAVNLTDGRVAWESANGYRGSAQDYIKFPRAGQAPVPKIDGAINIAMDDTTVALQDGKDLVALDRATGRQRWRAAIETAKDGDAWIGALIVKDGVVLHADRDRLVARAAATGKPLWDRPKASLGHLWYEWKEVFVIDGRVWTWSAETRNAPYQQDGKANKKNKANAKTRTGPAPQSVCAYNLHTGAVEQQVPLGNLFVANHHHRCYPDRATTRYILSSRRGSEYVDLLGGGHTVDNWVRGECHFGMLPANGLQYAPPHPCKCYLQEKLNGFNALAPERKDEGGRRKEEEGDSLLERGPAYAQTPTNPSSFIPHPSSDWPTYRHDAARSGAAKTAVPAQPAVLWTTRLGRKLSPPVMAGGRVFVAEVDEHQVSAVDTADGHVLWTFTTGGRVDSPPTVCGDAVVFGSCDGSVYCLRAGDGGLVWRFRAAPEDRQIAAFDQLESAWPVHGSVLVHGGTAYVTAGRSSHLDGGIWMYGLDVQTGAVTCRAQESGPAIDAKTMTINNQLPQGSLADILIGTESGIVMRGVEFDYQLARRQPGKRSGVSAPGGFLDDTYFKRVTWQFGPLNLFGQLFVDSGDMVFGMRTHPTLQCLTPNNFFTPGAAGYTFLGLQSPNGSQVWSRKYPVRARGLVATQGALFAAGPPDIVDARDPLGAFEGRAGGVLLALDAKSGEKLGEQRLPSPPVFDGLIAAGGRFLVALENGSVICLGEKP